MNRFFPFISCAFVGILVSSCARNPPSVVPVAYGSASGTPHRSAKHHHVALSQAPLRHPKAASEGHRRLLSPWNYSAPANAATPHTDHLPAAPETPAPANATTPPYGSPPDRPPCLGIPSYLRDRATRLLALARVTRRARSRQIFGPSLRSLELLLRPSTASDLAWTMYPIANRQSIAVPARRRQLISGLRPLAAVSQAAAIFGREPIFLPPRPPQTEFGIFGWRGVLSQNLIFRITTYKDTTQMAI
jgi:hypothetical protein